MAHPPLRLVHSSPSDSTPEGHDVAVRAEVDVGVLVTLVQNGDHQAAERLYRTFAPSVTRTVTRLLGSSQDADDVVQDAFVDAFEGLRSLREPAAFGGWLMSIAVHKVRRRIRRRVLMRKVGLDRTVEDAKLEMLSHSSTPVEARSQLRAIDRAVANMSADVRIAWMLRHIDGEQLQDIAVICGLSLATVKRRIAEGDALVHAESNKS